MLSGGSTPLDGRQDLCDFVHRVAQAGMTRSRHYKLNGPLELPGPDGLISMNLFYLTHQKGRPASSP